MASKVLYGINNLADVVDGKYMLVCDVAFEHLSITNYFDTSTKFDNITPNPTYEQVCMGVDLFKNSGCNSIVAVGGGSAIDVAKCIKIFSGMDKNINYLNQEIVDNGITLIAIPTTAGTGSESTRHAVIYYSGEKQSISHDSIIPNYAILDADVLQTLPTYQKKCTMLDALSQAVESWWSVASTQESKEYSKIAIDLIVENYSKYIFENNKTAAEKILLASNYAGRAINITATTAPHAMSYKLTSMYGLPHGHAVALCLPIVWEYMLHNVEMGSDKRGEEYIKGTFADIAKAIDIKRFVMLLNELNMHKPVSENRERDLELLTKSVNPIRLKNNPIMLNDETITSLYEKIIV